MPNTREHLLYVHPLTGLMINVDQITETYRTTDSGGTVYETVVGQRLETGAGQKAVAEEGGNLNVIVVVCRGVLIQLVRVHEGPLSKE